MSIKRYLDGSYEVTSNISGKYISKDEMYEMPRRNGVCTRDELDVMLGVKPIVITSECHCGFCGIKLKVADDAYTSDDYGTICCGCEYTYLNEFKLPEDYFDDYGK